MLVSLTMDANEKSFVHGTPTWRRWRHVKTKNRCCTDLALFYMSQSSYITFNFTFLQSFRTFVVFLIYTIFSHRPWSCNLSCFHITIHVPRLWHLVCFYFVIWVHTKLLSHSMAAYIYRQMTIVGFWIQIAEVLGVMVTKSLLPTVTRATFYGFWKTISTTWPGVIVLGDSTDRQTFSKKNKKRLDLVSIPTRSSSSFHSFINTVNERSLHVSTDKWSEYVKILPNQDRKPHSKSYACVLSSCYGYTPSMHCNFAACTERKKKPVVAGYRK
jgi:hypothetical protein